MLQEFKKFAMRGNVIDMAVGIIIGAAFTSVVNSLVEDIIMPPIGMLLGHVEFTNLYIILQEGDPVGPYTTLMEAQQAGAVTINYGLFFNNLISFLIVAFTVFLMLRTYNRIQDELEELVPEEPPITKNCSFCLSEINIKATRCPQCTSEL